MFQQILCMCVLRMSITTHVMSLLEAAVKVTSMLMCCDCVTPCVQSDWSSNCGTSWWCSSSTAAAVVVAVDCSKTCWFGKKRESMRRAAGRGSGQWGRWNQTSSSLNSLQSNKEGTLTLWQTVPASLSVWVRVCLMCLKCISRRNLSWPWLDPPRYVVMQWEI